jgi:hypothetical protein
VGASNMLGVQKKVVKWNPKPGQSERDLLKKYAGKDGRYCDPDFPCDESSLFRDGEAPEDHVMSRIICTLPPSYPRIFPPFAPPLFAMSLLLTLAANIGHSQIPYANVLWLRPEEYIESGAPIVFVDDAMPGDVIQGKLGTHPEALPPPLSLSTSVTESSM